MTTQTATFPEVANNSRSTSVTKFVMNSPAAGTMWFAGWLFTIGFAHLVWWKALLALVIWPYFIGVLIR